MKTVMTCCHSNNPNLSSPVQPASSQPKPSPLKPNMRAPHDKIQGRSVMRREPVSPASSGFITHQLWNIDTLFSNTSWLTAFLCEPCKPLHARILNFALGDPWYLQVFTQWIFDHIVGLLLWNWLRIRTDSYFRLVHRTFFFFLLVSYFLLNICGVLLWFR